MPERRRVASNEDGGKPPVARPLPQHTPFWEAFKVEFKLFLCTKNRKYQKLRREIAATVAESKDKAQPILVSMIAAAIGAKVGTLGVVIAPLVVISLMTVLTIGKEAYCRTVDVDSLIALRGD
jgi:hypothetical protein